MTDKETTTMGPAAHTRPRPLRRFLLIALIALAAGLTGAMRWSRHARMRQAASVSPCLRFSGTRPAADLGRNRRWRIG